MKNVLIIVLSIIVLCLGGYLVYDKIILNDNNGEVVDNNENNSSEGNDDVDNNNNEESNYDYKMIDSLLNEYLGGYINRVDVDGSNVIGTSEGRLTLLDLILTQLKLCTWHDDGTIQAFPYVTYDTYRNKYIEVFGNYANLASDLENVSSSIANDCSYSSLSANNICWNGNWGVTGDKRELTSAKVLNSGNDSYKIIGTYARYDYEKTVIETGTFEIEYVKNSNSKYLTSIKLIKD